MSGVSEGIEGEAGETTLYYDAEEGVLRDEDGDEVVFETGPDDEDEDPDTSPDVETEEDEAEGSRTPQPPAAAEPPQRATQSITSTSPTTRRPSRLRRLSSATQTRVSNHCVALLIICPAQ